VILVGQMESATIRDRVPSPGAPGFTGTLNIDLDTLSTRLCFQTTDRMWDGHTLPLDTPSFVVIGSRSS